MLSFDDEPERTFDALELRKMAIDCLEIGSVKGMAHKLDRLVNPSGEDLSSLSATNRRRVCRNVFTHGSLVWNCQNCQSDPTCVQVCENEMCWFCNVFFCGSCCQSPVV